MPRTPPPDSAVRLTVTSLGNAGFLVEHGNTAIVVDPFDWSLPLITASARRFSLILVTHDHWDHFDRRRVAELSASRGATVCGPRRVVRALEGTVAPGRLQEVEPPPPSGHPRRSVPIAVTARGVPVLAYRSHHSRDHTSYLVDLGGVRLFHDGDNQDTTLYDPELLRDLDCLMLCPWQGSGWESFIRTIRPRRWLLMHLEDEELDVHDRGAFLPPLCESVPMEPVALRSGRSIVITS